MHKHTRTHQSGAVPLGSAQSCVRCTDQDHGNDNYNVYVYCLASTCTCARVCVCVCTCVIRTRVDRRLYVAKSCCLRHVIRDPKTWRVTQQEWFQFASGLPKIASTRSEFLSRRIGTETLTSYYKCRGSVQLADVFSFWCSGANLCVYILVFIETMCCQRRCRTNDNHNAMLSSHNVYVPCVKSDECGTLLVCLNSAWLVQNKFVC